MSNFQSRFDVFGGHLAFAWWFFCLSTLQMKIRCCNNPSDSLTHRQKLSDALFLVSFEQIFFYTNMIFEKKRLENLRVKLKECYAFNYKDEKERLGYLKSTKTSEKNPFLQLLSTDLSERFKDVNKKQTGFSPYTLRNLFFDINRLNYDGDTIANLELYCSEIEEEMNEEFINAPEEKEQLKDTLNRAESSQKKKRRNRYFYMTGIFLLGILMVLYWVLKDVGNSIVEKTDETISDLYTGKFNTDPSKNGLGFFTINNTEDNIANTFNSLIIDSLNVGDEVFFFTYIDFHNEGTKPIKKATAKIHISESEMNKGILTLTAELAGEDVPKIHDVVEIVNFSYDYELKFIEGYIENTHGKSDHKECQGYEYKIHFGEEIFTKGVSIDELDTYEGGWCDQGYVITKFSVIRKPKPIY